MIKSFITFLSFFIPQASSAVATICTLGIKVHVEEEEGKKWCFISYADDHRVKDFSRKKRRRKNVKFIQLSENWKRKIIFLEKINLWDRKGNYNFYDYQRELGIEL